jgi:putative transposase
LTGRYEDVARDKQKALDERCAQNPERFVRGRPVVRLPPATVAINPILAGDDGNILNDRVNFPTLTAAGYVK